MLVGLVGAEAMFLRGRTFPRAVSLLRFLVFLCSDRAAVGADSPSEPWAVLSKLFGCWIVFIGEELAPWGKLAPRWELAALPTHTSLRLGPTISIRRPE